MQFGSAKSTSGHGQPKGAATPAFCLMFFSYDWNVQSLVITLSSRDVLINWDNLHRLSILLAHCFGELRELIVIMERLDFKTPGVRDEITFMDLTPKSFPEDNAVTHNTQTSLSLGKELVLSVIHGEWKPNHWYNLVCSMTRSMKFYFMRKQETVQTMPSLNKTNPAEDLYCALEGFKTSIGMSTGKLLSIFYTKHLKCSANDETSGSRRRQRSPASPGISKMDCTVCKISSRYYIQAT